MNILITGGASGLGEAITGKLAEDKANKVYFTYCRSEQKAKELEKTNAIAIRLDFTDPASVQEFILSLQKLDIDVLINNAITGYSQDYFHKISSKVFVDSFKTNVFPTIQLTQELIRLFRKRKFGKIITILTSGLIDTPPVGWSEYTANKAYLHSMVKSWAIENNSFNITSNAVSPSFMLTNLTSRMDERLVELSEQNHPLKKMLKPEEVADSVNFLVNSTQQINGINLILNAGVHVI